MTENPANSDCSGESGKHEFVHPQPQGSNSSRATCRGSYGLGSACGNCKRCDSERKSMFASTDPARQPFYVHCSWCKHEWAAFYLPMEVSKVADIGKRAICPSCGDTKVICGKAS